MSSDAGTSWSAPTALNTNAATDTEGDNDPQLTTDGLGTWIATWHSYDDLGGTIGTDADILYAVLTIVTPEEDTGAGGGSSTCFIATAAYGTPMATEIDTLRAVRDTYMMNNVIGSAFVDTYYRLSPAIADKVAESPVLAAAVRAILTPFVLVGKLILAAPMALVGLMLTGAGLALTSRRARGQQS